MSFARTPRLLVLLLLGWLVATKPISAADSPLTRAKDLYASAAYEEALAALDQLDGAEPAADARAAAEYRVFCLLALDRRDEARKFIEIILHENPHYMPSSGVTSPRIESAIRDVRRQALPKIVTERYALAKTAFERKDPQALPQFDEVLRLLDDPDINGVATFGDLRTVAIGFRDLAQAMAAAPPASPAPARAAAPAPAKAESLPTPAADASAVVYTAGDAEVTPPIARTQKLPELRMPTRETAKEFKGTLELLIDQQGSVVSATLRRSVYPAYDPVLLKAAHEWKFVPATRQGVPVRYLKFMEIRLQINGG